MAPAHVVTSVLCTCFSLVWVALGNLSLIHAIRAQIAEVWKYVPDAFMCAIAAPTGLAAFNIGSVTVHRLFQLPVEHDSKTSAYWPVPFTQSVCNCLCGIIKS